MNEVGKTDMPRFAVVGHPNKGKSSIVSALAEDDSVVVNRMSGTTVKCRTFPMTVDGRVMYTLVDTPGFQRARAALGWIKAHETTAAEHEAVVRRFVDEHAGGERFYSECELLKPVLDGAGVLYVVDGSVPYGPEYEAEMEILRWTGAASMALINPMGKADHVASWRGALGQYFKLVRVFDAFDGGFDKRVGLLESFGHLREDWRETLVDAVACLREEREYRHERVAKVMAMMVADMLSMTQSKLLSKDSDSKAHQAALMDAFMGSLRRREGDGRVAVEHIYEHHRLAYDEDGGDKRSAVDSVVRELLAQDLFSTDTWYMWGLDRKQLLATGLIGGAMAGGVIDAAMGGASFLTGAVVGGGVGALTALLGAGKLPRMKVSVMPLGGTKLRCGPVKDVNFPFVVLGRALFHHEVVSGRSHADRRTLRLVENEAKQSGWTEELSVADRKRLTRWFSQMREGLDRRRAMDAVDGLAGWLVEGGRISDFKVNCF